MPVLTQEQKEIKKAVRKFTEDEIIPLASDIHRYNREIPEDIIRKMSELGYFGLIFPEEYDGAGLDYVTMAIVTEELSRGLLSAGSIMTRSIITGTLLEAHGTQEQKDKFLPPICRGEIMTAAAFTEPDYGSDLGNVQLRAVKKDGGYVLNGEKTWCTYANRAGLLTVMARTDPDPGKRHKGLSIFLVEKEPADGIVHDNMSGSSIPTIGYHGMKSWSVSFDNCFVPSENIIGLEENRGFYQLMATFESARIQTAARAVGVAQAALEAAIKYSRERHQFGKPISEFQAIRMKLSEMASRLEAARQLTHYASSIKDTGKRCDLEAGMAKTISAEMVEYVTREAMQIHGGYGYSEEYPVERFWRDGRVISLFEGTTEIQHEIIARRLLEIY